MHELTPSWRFWAFWALAFVGFPMAGVASNLVATVTTPARALISGLVAGATLGLVQWFVLRPHLPLLPIGWVAATSAGLAIGLALSTALLGIEMTGNGLLYRAAITGLTLGVAQWLVLQRVIPQSHLWVAVVCAGWVLGWSIMRGIGVNLTYHWTVFGSAGALVYQLITGLALHYLLRSA
jgi:hypothetical protein